MKNKCKCDRSKFKVGDVWLYDGGHIYETTIERVTDNCIYHTMFRGWQRIENFESQAIERIEPLTKPQPVVVEVKVRRKWYQFWK